MKKVIIVLFLFFICANVICDEVQGDTLTYDGKKILRVWGNHYERGYAYGYLMAEQIKELALDYFLGSYFYNNPVIYNTAIDYVTSYFVIEDKYQQEFNGIIAGMTDTGIDLYSTTLSRNLGVDDLLLCNCVTDLAGFLANYGIGTLGCSSMSSWGNSTLSDPILQGDIVITRNMDWSSNAILQSNHLMIISFPEEEDEQPWLSMGFSGMIGSLSGVNNNGTCAFMNVGNINNAQNPGNLHPIFLSIRNGLEQIDYNNDGITNNFDVWNAVSDKIHYGSSIVHCVTNPQALIIEVNNENGSVYRTVDDNFEVLGENLVATNHFRTLYNPVYCYRYAAFVDSLENSEIVSFQRNWDITTSAGGVSNNLHTMEYAPTLNKLLWSTTHSGIPAYARTPTTFDLTQWFETPVSAEEEAIPDKLARLIIFPNPAKSEVLIKCKTNRDEDLESVSIYNIKGQKILFRKMSDSKEFYWDFSDDRRNLVAPGIYLVRIKSTNGIVAEGKIVKLQ